MEDVGKIIIGVNIESAGKIEGYQAAIINGSFDVDKLGYIKKGSYTAGLALNFDIERLFTKIQIRLRPLSVDRKVETDWSLIEEIFEADGEKPFIGDLMTRILLTHIT